MSALARLFDGVIVKAAQASLRPIAGEDVRKRSHYVFVLSVQKLHQSLLAIRRAGADRILTYFAKAYATDRR